MIELKGLSDDVMKNDSDTENYNREFKDLQNANLRHGCSEVQRSEHVRPTTANAAAGAGCLRRSQSKQVDNTVSVFVSGRNFRNDR